eukprot:scaffold139899_cov15-Tisochrysis_lutea.AAC.1
MLARCLQLTLLASLQLLQLPGAAAGTSKLLCRPSEHPVSGRACEQHHTEPVCAVFHRASTLQ